MSPLFDLFAFLLLLAAAFGWINARFLKMPSNIGLLLMGVLASIVLLAIDLVLPGAGVVAEVGGILRRIDFYDAVMNGMLAFLLFAGGLHVEWEALRKRVGTVTVLATVGVLISTVTIGFGFWALAHLLGLGISLPWSLVFGALISPTDPVAVLSLLKSARVPQLLEIEMAGESLFNDGVGVVLFTILVAVAAVGDHVSIPSAIGLFLLEAVGGGLIGFAAGTIAFYAMRAIDDYVVEVIISLALVTVTYALAGRLHTSGPIAVVVAAC